MLGKIWGLALLMLGIYVACELNRLPDVKDNKIKSTSTKNSSSKPMSNSEPSAHSAETSASTEAVASRGDEKYILVPKTFEEMSEELAELCEQMQVEIKVAKIPVQFSKLNLQFREKRLATAFLKKQLNQCFRQSETSPNIAELEIFSSDFAGENAAYQVQLQVSILDKRNHNKIYEIARKFEMAKRSPVIPSQAEK